MSGHDVDVVVDREKRAERYAREVYGRALEALNDVLTATILGHDLDAVAWRLAEVGVEPGQWLILTPECRARAIEEAKWLISLALKPGDRLPGGLRVVPEEPSPDMMQAVLEWNRQFDRPSITIAEEWFVAGEIYRAMLKAAASDGT